MGVKLGLTLREGHRLKVLENRVLRYISESKKKQVTQDSRKLHIEELYDSYCSPNIIRVIKSRSMKGVRHVAGIANRYTY
jgi:ribosomal protein S13